VVHGKGTRINSLANSTVYKKLKVLSIGYRFVVDVELL
jgi:hypothetical protein